MSKDSVVTANREETFRLINKVRSNVHCLDANDLKVLEFLGKKGFYEKQKIKIVPTK